MYWKGGFINDGGFCNNDQTLDHGDFVVNTRYLYLNPVLKSAEDGNTDNADRADGTTIGEDTPQQRHPRSYERGTLYYIILNTTVYYFFLIRKKLMPR